MLKCLHSIQYKQEILAQVSLPSFYYLTSLPLFFLLHISALFICIWLTVDPQIHFLDSYTACFPFNLILLLCLIFSLCLPLSVLFYPVTSLFWKKPKFVSKNILLSDYFLLFVSTSTSTSFLSPLLSLSSLPSQSFILEFLYLSDSSGLKNCASLLKTFLTGSLKIVKKQDLTQTWSNCNLYLIRCISEKAFGPSRRTVCYPDD